MTIILSHGGTAERVDVRDGADAGVVRELSDTLEELGVPDRFTLAVNGIGVDDKHVLAPNDTVTFRPVSAEKGC